MRRQFLMLRGIAMLLSWSWARADEWPLAQEWDYAPAMRKVAATAHARVGVVLHVGDSITYANPYGQWARGGRGHSPADEAALKWMHAGARDDSDGWYLCAFDHPDGGRSYTACGGIRIDEMLAGGKDKMPPLPTILDQYRPQAVVFMLGTNDVSAGRSTDSYRKDLEQAVDLMLDRGIVCILSTIPPHPHNPTLGHQINDVIRQIARERSLPLIDFEREILKRRPNDWNGTLLAKDDAHPTAEQSGTTAAAEPTGENLRNSGYLLRGWLSVKKIEEVKERVFDPLVQQQWNDHSTATRQPAGVAYSSAFGGTQPRAAGPRTETQPRAARTETQPGAAGPKEVRLPVTRDTWFSCVGHEADCNLGGAGQLKLKSYQEMSLVDIDPAPLKGHRVLRAALHVRKRGEEPLHRVTVSSFNSEWVEGTATSYEPQVGSSSFNSRQYPNVPWAYPGSDLTAVTLGQGGTIWSTADASAPDAQGWMQVPVGPAVVAARVAGISHGFLLFDDTGSEWTRDGERFTLRAFPNRFVFSRDQGKENAPYVTVELIGDSGGPPVPPTELRADSTDLPAGEAMVSWLTPPDHVGQVAIGFFVSVDGKPVPQYLVPSAGNPGQRVTMHLRDMGLKPGQGVELAVRAVDGAGNISEPGKLQVRVSNEVDLSLPGIEPEPFTDSAELPKLGNAEVAIIDALDKVEPREGRTIPAQEPAYLCANHLWSARQKLIRLHAARNEFVAFQILMRGPAKDISAKLQFDGAGEQPTVRFYRLGDVETKAGPMPDPLLPNVGPYSVPPGDKSGSVLCEVYVPHELAPGSHPGMLILSSGGEDLKVAVDLGVWDFTLPDFLSFIPEMNCYGLPPNEVEYYRLAHRDRTILNRVPYSQRGEIEEGCAPAWDGRRLDWSAWDKRFGPYLNGSAFNDLPRKGVPLEIFYLPLHENWPTPMEGNYNGTYWADQAFPPSYRDAFVECSRQFAGHFNQKHWDSTIFQCFFNGKNNFKESAWSHGSSPWLLDEPGHFQDFWALRWFGLAFQDGVRQAPGDAKLLFRCDISRPQWQRDALDPVLNYNVVAGGPFHEYHRLVMERKRRLHQIVITYGSTNDPADSNVQPVGWCLDSWTLGADGVLPWQVIGDDNAWKHGQDTCLFYPGGPVGLNEPVPSIRLKAYLRGEQDVEYLTLLARIEHQSQLQLGRRVRQAYNLTGVRQGTGFTGGEDAGVIDFAHLRPQDLWKLRERIGRVISNAHPKPMRKLVDMGRIDGTSSSR